jgi:sialic acid synthase SpsE
LGVLVIAEVGSVHDGSFGNALRLIEMAAETGADAVKFQTHIAAAETLQGAPEPPFFKAEPRFEYFQRTAFSPEQWRRLKQACDERGVTFLSSPFSEEAVVLLEKVGVTAYKVPSGEVTNLPLLDVIGRTGKPVLLSSGMSSWQELDDAVGTLRRHHARLTLLQCTSEYPCPYEQVGLNVMLEMGRRYDAPFGLSDHTLTPWASVAAVTLGASAIERHVTFSRRMYGSDAGHSLEPDELRQLVEGIRAVETVLASPVDKDDTERFAGMKRVFEKSLAVLRDTPAGERITPEVVGPRKPGTGIPAARLAEILGRRAARPLRAGALLETDDVEWED